MAKISSLKNPKFLGKKTIFPKQVKPMLATLIDEPFNDPDWFFEIKWDGYRTISLINKNKVQLLSRNNKSFNEKFYPIYEELKLWNMNIVLDGEIIVENKKGVSDFGNLQNWKKPQDGLLLYYVFDLLWCNGYNLMNVPLKKRRDILKSILPQSTHILFSESIAENGQSLFKTAARLGLEGIIAKRNDSFYEEGIRSKEWLKIKTRKRQEVVIGGYTINQDSPKPFSSLLVGVYHKNEFTYIGKVGTGFSIKLQNKLLVDFKRFVVKNSRFFTIPDIEKANRFRTLQNTSVIWMKPALVCEVYFQEITADGLMRHPSFAGMRTDKNPKEVVLESRY